MSKRVAKLCHIQIDCSFLVNAREKNTTLKANLDSISLQTFQTTSSVFRKLLPKDGKYYGGADNTDEAYCSMAEDIIVLRSQEGINLALQGTSRKILELLKAKRLDDPNNTLICITVTPKPSCQPLL